MRLPNNAKLIAQTREGDFGACFLLCRRAKPTSIPELARLVYPNGGLDAERFDAIAECFEAYEDRMARLAAQL